MTAQDYRDAIASRLTKHFTDSVTGLLRGEDCIYDATIFPNHKNGPKLDRAIFSISSHFEAIINDLLPEILTADTDKRLAAICCAE